MLSRRGALSVPVVCLLLLAGCAPPPQVPVQVVRAAPEAGPAAGPLEAAVQIVAVPQAGLGPLAQARLQRDVALAAAASARPHRIGTDFDPNLILFIEDRAGPPTGLRDVDRPEVLEMRTRLAGGGCHSAWVGTVIVGHVPAADPEAARTACIRRLVLTALRGGPV